MDLFIGLKISKLLRCFLIVYSARYRVINNFNQFIHKPVRAFVQMQELSKHIFFS